MASWKKLISKIVTVFPSILYTSNCATQCTFGLKRGLGLKKPIHYLIFIYMCSRGLSNKLNPTKYFFFLILNQNNSCVISL